MNHYANVLFLMYKDRNLHTTYILHHPVDKCHVKTHNNKSLTSNQCHCCFSTYLTTNENIKQ